MINILNLDRPGLTAFFAELGEKPFRSDQLMKWIYQQGVIDFDAMTNLSKGLRQRLKDQAYIMVPEVISTQISADGTYKWLLRLDNNNYIESVFIPEADRNTLCISSQVGCALNCHFCATARQGFNRNLTTAEIIGQLWLAESLLAEELKHAHGATQQRLISNVVLMGMGEPLTNLTQVLRAIQLMMDDCSYGLSKRRVTVSTVGIIPALAQLKRDCDVNLAISLHAPEDNLRNQLIPLNRKYPLADLLTACRAYNSGEQRRKITFEYVMLKDINDTPAHARALVKLLQHCPGKVNLIPFNPFPHSPYQCSTTTRIAQFREILMRSGFVTTTRKTRGDDIEAACGQLAGKVQYRSSRKLSS